MMVNSRTEPAFCEVTPCRVTLLASIKGCTQWRIMDSLFWRHVHAS